MFLLGDLTLRMRSMFQKSAKPKTGLFTVTTVLLLVGLVVTVFITFMFNYFSLFALTTQRWGLF
jgi:hypothetical protein